MRKICKVALNGEPSFLANCGDLLLDWALMNGVDLPHDCRSGICGACKVRLVDGTVFGGHTRGDDMIHACQARIVSDLEIAIEAAPEPVSLSARVANTVQLAPDVVGVDVELSKPLQSFPGQYCKLQFRGLPARALARPIRWKAVRTIACCTSTSEKYPTAWCRRRWGAISAPATVSN